MKSISFEKRPVIWKHSTVIELLLFFFDNPTEEFFEKQVADKTKVSAGAANKYLKILAKEGFLRIEKKGNMNFYSLERENPVVRHMKIAYSLSKPITSELKNLSKKLNVKIYVYGSVARGEDTEESDWDILAIGQAGLSEIEGELNVIRKKFGEKLKLMAFSVSEWARMEKNDKAFYERVEKDKIELV
jgi:predicted nucleotidyltransferase